MNNLLATAQKNVTWPQFKIFMSLLAQDTSSKNFGRYSTSLVELTRIAGFVNWRDKESVMEAIHTIVDCLLVIPNYEDEENGVGYAFIQPLSYVHWNEGMSEIVFELNSRVMKMFVDLKKNFTLTNLKEFQGLRNSRSGHLFVLASYCKNFVLETKRTFEVDWLCAYLGIALTTNWHDRWVAMYRAAVIVCERTSINLQLVCCKRGEDGRKVTHITLVFHKQIDNRSLGKPQFFLEDEADDA